MTDIARAVSAEYGPVPVEDGKAFFDVLQQAGLVSVMTRQ